MIEDRMSNLAETGRKPQVSGFEILKVVTVWKVDVTDLYNAARIP